MAANIEGSSFCAGCSGPLACGEHMLWTMLESEASQEMGYSPLMTEMRIDKGRESLWLFLRISNSPAAFYWRLIRSVLSTTERAMYWNHGEPLTHTAKSLSVESAIIAIRRESSKLRVIQIEDLRLTMSPNVHVN